MFYKVIYEKVYKQKLNYEIMDLFRKIARKTAPIGLALSLALAGCDKAERLSEVKTSEAIIADKKYMADIGKDRCLTELRGKDVSGWLDDCRLYHRFEKGENIVVEYQEIRGSGLVSFDSLGPIQQFKWDNNKLINYNIIRIKRD